MVAPRVPISDLPEQVTSEPDNLLIIQDGAVTKKITVQHLLTDTVNAGLNTHLIDPIDAHDASAISMVPAAGISASDVQSAFTEVVSRTITTTAPLTGGGNLQADRTLSVSQFTSTAPGVVGASGGGTANYLRADGSWTAPAGGGGGGGLPAGGTVGQILGKTGTGDFVVGWVADQVGGGGVSDGNKGDVSVSGSGTTWTLNTNTVTNPKLATMPGLSLKGNSSASIGAAADLGATAVKTLLGLSNVDNTSDASKPISTATSTALNTKVSGTGITAIVAISQAAYDALSPPSSTTAYFITS